MSNSYSQSVADREKLPIYVHTEVLGVDIGVWQRDNKGIDITVYGRGRTTVIPDVTRELSAWARRNLFDGAGPS